VQSSRRLETESQHHLELISLTARLAPDFKTIADFRRDNGEAIRKVCKEFELLHDSIKRALVELDRADRDAAAAWPGRVAHPRDRITQVKQQSQAQNEVGEQMKPSKRGQISLTDPDARSLATSGRGIGVVGYNVQTVFDARHHFIAAREVTNVGHDRNLRPPALGRR
jgi:hypothetical protein